MVTLGNLKLKLAGIIKYIFIFYMIKKDLRGHFEIENRY